MGFPALATGYTVASIIRPGVGLRLKAPLGWTVLLHLASAVDVLIGLIPRSVVQPFLELNMLQIIATALLTGFTISLTGTFSPETKEFLEVFGLGGLFGILVEKLKETSEKVSVVLTSQTMFGLRGRAKAPRCRNYFSLRYE
ncbi:MAG: cation:dicarboxylase symporter family transporter [Sulfolobales archaeon]